MSMRSFFCRGYCEDKTEQERLKKERDIVYLEKRLARLQTKREVARKMFAVSLPYQLNGSGNFPTGYRMFDDAWYDEMEAQDAMTRITTTIERLRRETV